MKYFLLFLIPIQMVFSFRGVWLPISGTNASYSEQGIVDAVNRCKYLEIDTIYFAVWNQLMINYLPKEPQILEKYKFLKVNPKFLFDPLKILIRESHKNSIRVIAWFQYGFATTYNDPTGGIIFSQNPSWKAINYQGQLVSKNNFQWMNAFHPQVQEFMLSLIKQVLVSYPQIDGIQGDDRLPALPSIGGYDEYTVSQYKKDHEGKCPPSDEKDEDWVNWRCDLLNKFMMDIFSVVKQMKTKQGKNYEIHMAPSVFPWSKSQYLQDWPTWVSANLTDRILPQIYRYDIQAYSQTLLNNYDYVPPSKKSSFVPGILIGIGSNPVANINILYKSLEINRGLKLEGESYFYYESLKDKRVVQIIKSS